MPTHVFSGLNRTERPCRHSRVAPRIVIWGGCACMALVPGSWAECQDRAAPPETLLLSVDTRAALRISGELPGLGNLGTEGNSPDLRTWVASWEMGASRGRKARTDLYDKLGTQGFWTHADSVSAAIRQVETALQEVRGLQGDLPLHVSLSVGESERFLSRALSARDQGQWPDASLLVLKAADALREVGPKTVALTLIETAEAALAESPLREGVTQEEASRARRLVRWARSALFNNGHPKAIQRAYYACRLAGVILP